MIVIVQGIIERDKPYLHNVVLPASFPGIARDGDPSVDILLVEFENCHRLADVGALDPVAEVL